MNYRNLGLLVVALVLTAGAGGIWIAYMNASQKVPTSETDTNANTPIAPPATVTPALSESPDVIVGFDMDNTTLALNESMDLTVKLDSSSSQVQTLALALKFDPGVIRVNSIDGTGAFNLYLGDKIDTINGYAQISGSMTGGKLVSNDPSFAKINVTRISTGSTKITVAKPGSAQETNPTTEVVLNTGTAYSVPEKSITIN